MHMAPFMLATFFWRLLPVEPEREAITFNIAGNITFEAITIRIGERESVNLTVGGNTILGRDVALESIPIKSNASSYSSGEATNMAYKP